MKCIECGFLCDHHPIRLREKIENVVLPAKPVTEASRMRATTAPRAASFGRI